MQRGCIYVIRTFMRSYDQTAAPLPPTICFERTLALDMAEADREEAVGVAVYEIEPATQAGTITKPFMTFGFVPASYHSIRRDALLAAPAVAEPPLRQADQCFI